MKKSEILEIEINSTIEKISLLPENDKIDVYNLLLNVYKKVKDIPKEEFINDFYYQSYQTCILLSKPRIEEQLNSLKTNNDDDTNTSKNFFQIKASISMLSAKKFTK